MRTLISLFVSLFIVSVSLFAQTNTGKTITTSGVSHEVFMGAKGGLYYINSNGNKTYLSDTQKTNLGLTASTSQTTVSVPTSAQVQKEVAKEKVLIDNGATVIYHGVTFTVETGARGGRFFTFVNANGNVKKHYLARN